MKRNLTFLGLALLIFGLAGCEDDNPVFDPTPATPQGVYSITGDNAVYLYFNGIYESDVVEYRVYRSLDSLDNYHYIGAVEAEYNPDLDLYIYEFVDDGVTNGVTYYYGVTALDRAGHESELSAEMVYDTPRPEGTDVLFPNNLLASASGFNFESGHVVWDTSQIADVYIDIFDDIYYLNARDLGTDLQDMGYTENFDVIGYSPVDGWSQLGYVELVAGHTYVIWTRDYHFAKMRVVSINPSGSANIQWAYQTDQDNPELAPVINPPQKPAHGPDYLRHNETSRSSVR